MNSVVVGIDIGGTNFRMGAVDRAGNVKHFVKKPSKKLLLDNAVNAIIDELNLFLKENEINNLKAITIGIPSTVSKEKDRVISTPNLKGLDNVDLRSPLEKEFGVPIYVDRDVNYLLENDIDTLNLDRTKTIAGFYIGTGFGNAIFMNGEVLVGKNGAAGELGHIPLFGVEDVCTCGNVGCAETRCSGKYLEQIQRKYYPNTDISDIFVKHGNDPIVKKYVKELAIPIATEINILDPNYIVIAGGVVIMDGFPKDELIEAIHFYARKPYPEQNLCINFTEHKQESGVLGGAKFIFNNENNGEPINNNIVSIKEDIR